MKLFFSYTCVLALCSAVFVLQAMVIERYPQILKNLEVGRNSEIEKYQNLAVSLFSSNQVLPWESIDCLINILLLHDKFCPHRFSYVADRINFLDGVIKSFKDIPGFYPILMHVLARSHLANQPFRRWFQLEVAYDIENSQIDETVDAFGQPSLVDQPNGQVVMYNVITNKRWIACKTVDWAKIQANRSRRQVKNLKKALLHSKKVADNYNKACSKELLFQICSHVPVTPFWQEWLEHQQIPHYQLPVS